MDSMRSNSIHHFCKIILSDHSGFRNKLMIPRRFVSKYGDNLPARVILKTPDGVMSWTVDLERSGDQVWLQKGWPEFAKFHSLSLGHFLIFGYQENSNQFDVVICDQSAFEIEYPSSSIDKKTSNARDSTTENTRVSVKVEDMNNSDASMQDFTKAKGGNGTEKIVAIASAKSFESTWPSCRITLYPSCITRSGGLTIPRGFVMKFMAKERDDLILQVEGKSWPVKCFRYLSNAHLGAGWTPFVRDNNLSAGDVCVFELIDCNKKLLNVSIIRANKCRK